MSIRTNTYKTDSDVVRHFGTIKDVLISSRFSRKGKLYETSSDHLKRLEMLKKSRKNDKHTLWMVSNCNSTPGAIARWNYGQSLIQAGLKVKGEGACFKNGRSDKNFNSQTYGDPSVESRVHFYRFYLAFENAFHCTDYIDFDTSSVMYVI